MKRLFGLIACLCLYAVASQAQSTWKLSGTVLDGQSGEGLPSASLYRPATKSGTAADLDGNFLLTIEGDTATYIISSAGYNAQVIRLERRKAPEKLNISLTLLVQSDVTITETRSARETVRSTQMSLETLTAQEAKMLPSFLGEVDLIKTLSLKPGVSTGSEGSSGLYIRGGGPDQNLMLVDNVPLYNPYHLFGFFSTFNNDAVQKVDLYKSGFPARYGGRLSSVVDVSMRQGNPEKLSVNGGVGLISSRLAIEGPALNKKVTWLVAGRRTYFDVFTRAINEANANNRNFDPIPNYYFYDLNAKVGVELGPKDRLSFTGYYGRDVFGFNRAPINFDFDWGNTALNAQWSRQWNPSWQSVTAVSYANYNYEVSNRFGPFSVSLGSGVSDYIARQDWFYTGWKGHEIQLGGSFIRHQFDIGRANGSSTDGTFSFNSGQTLGGNEYGLYLSDDFEVSQRLKLNLGLRFSGFANQGQNYNGLEPRASARYMLDENSSLKLGYARMYQYIHLVASSGASLPTDLWYPSNARVRPQISDQWALGYSRELGGGGWLFSIEGYYKNLQRQIDFKDGANLFLNDNLDTVFVFGKGWAYGTEFYLEKKLGKTRGWIGYTLAWSYRQFPDINEGRAFFPRNDRRHDVSVVLMHQLNDRFTLSGTWVYGTGNAVTLPQGRFIFQDVRGASGPPYLTIAPDVLERNGFRMPAYHRMDLAVVYKLRPRWGEADLTFSVYNVYSRMNAFFIFFETVTDQPDGTGNITGFRARQVSLFPIIPTVTYNFKF